MGEQMLRLFLLLLLPSGGNDLLDYVHTKSYWRAMEVEPTVSNLIDVARPDMRRDRTPPRRGPTMIPRDDEGFAGRQVDPVQRLMAIRALGEMRARESLPVLRALVHSKENFVAEYAQAAIAAIEGKPFSRQSLGAEERRKDPWRLPADCGAVAQVAYPGGGPVSLERVFELTPSLSGLSAEEKADLLQEMSVPALGALNNIGNMRIESLTVGVSGYWGEHGGWVVVIARGLYDCGAVKDLFKAMNRKFYLKSEDGGWNPLLNPPYQYVGEEEVAVLPVSITTSLTFIMPSDTCLAVVAGPRQQVQPVRDVVMALRRGRGTLEQNAKLAGLVKSIDTSQPFWAAVAVTPSYRQVPLLEPFDTVTLASKAGPKQTGLTLRARGRDAGKVAAVAARLSALVALARAHWEQQRPQVPESFLPMGAMFRSVELLAEGSELSGSATVPNALSRSARLIPFLALDGEGPLAYERDYRAGLRPTAPVAGKVTFNGKPVKEGVIMFIPKHPLRGPAATGTITGGTFENVTSYRRRPGKGALVGEHKVVIHVPPEGEFQLPAHFSDSATTPLTFTVKEGPNTFTVDLRPGPQDDDEDS